MAFKDHSMPKVEEKRRSITNPTRCFKCNVVGHIAINCPTKRTLIFSEDLNGWIEKNEDDCRAGIMEKEESSEDQEITSFEADKEGSEEEHNVEGKGSFGDIEGTGLEEEADFDAVTKVLTDDAGAVWPETNRLNSNLMKIPYKALDLSLPSDSWVKPLDPLVILKNTAPRVVPSSPIPFTQGHTGSDQSTRQQSSKKKQPNTKFTSPSPLLPNFGWFIEALRICLSEMDRASGVVLCSQILGPFFPGCCKGANGDDLSLVYAVLKHMRNPVFLPHCPSILSGGRLSSRVLESVGKNKVK
ncbi:hypothetical protein M9H77_07890 [Catharanthus roseus]|uniref:Uncharacterized protein n=1 Tax=Catharanthus roseus TaxID=4058 RepID=A0ACC0BW80_CATRO|nr:hypothetical protein M9H77_07890 [Catharanthus roseus]